MPKDIEHAEVASIISGYRVTLTYDLYTGADNGGALLVPAKDYVLNSFCPLANEHPFRDTFSALLNSENPVFLAEGGNAWIWPEARLSKRRYPNDEVLSDVWLRGWRILRS